MRMEPGRIMCAIDFSDFTHMIVSYGKSLAKEYEAKLYLCHIVPALMVASHMSSLIDYAGIEKEHIHNARARLAQIAKEFGIQCEIMVSVGHPADQIEQAVRQNRIDMVIAATNGGPGVVRFLSGSVTNKLVKILSCPLLVLHAKEDGISLIEQGIKLNRILVGCDFSPDSRLAFDYALSLAQEFQTQLYLAHVTGPMEPVELMVSNPVMVHGSRFSRWAGPDYKDPGEKPTDETIQKRDEWFKQMMTRLSEMVPEDSRNWCTPVTMVLEGKPYQELIDYSEEINADMIVLGVRGHSLLEQFLVGSTTDRVISRASCPVLAVRQTS
ncbi:MAG: universal stress protein UspA [Desulfobacterales bacterium RIFOXYA12_FULL_46_15]|nr:MAG: universal stress protein UspA [Desulfobacula sp. GWF2_41_7]OGR22732.1 MAG: universal stress protein UspA [Desulfobacterales bacterium RIFOXYA12_FULL_46_15]